MNNRIFFKWFLLLCIPVVDVGLLNDWDVVPSWGHSGDSTSFAVVELFTSEGCSTCPRADKFMSDLQNSYRTKNLPVYVLAFHVDYWDKYGWTDIYAKSEFTDRQRRYGSFFKLESVYTPQIIINGQEEMVGSDERAVFSIETALEKPAPIAVKIEPVLDAFKKKVQLHYTLSSVTKNVALNVALSESEIKREIWRGENSGRTLNHNNVVRLFKIIKNPKQEGQIELKLPSDLNIEKCRVVVYLQETQSMKIIGASDSALE